MAILITKQEEERVRGAVQAYWERFCDIREYMELSERLQVKAPYNFNITLYAELADKICSLLFRFLVNDSTVITDGTLIDVKRMDLIKLSRTATIMSNNANYLLQYHAEAADYDGDGQLDRYYQDMTNAVENINAIEINFAKYQISKVLRLVLDAYGIDYMYQDQMCMM